MHPAQNQSQSSRGDPMIGFLDLTADDLRALILTAEQTDQALADVRTRVFGAYPKSGETSGAVSPVPNGKADALKDQMRYLQIVLDSVRESAGILSDRL